jgi:antitoxin component YwqK of YwqJK toxin-antitoxin module
MQELAVTIFKLSMTQSDNQTFSLNNFYKTISILLTVVCFFSCNAQSSKDTVKTVDTNPKVDSASLHFTAHIVENDGDGSKAEIDTVTGYRKYFFANGKLQMEGKVTKASPKEYRDGIWNYYNEAGQLMKQETYNKEGKINELNFMYFTNGKPLSKTYQYYEGDYKDKSTFKFHKIETLFYTNGQELAERHWVNNTLVDEKCWDSKGNPKPIEYLKTVKSVEADE